MGHYRPAARWGGWALGWAGWWGAPKQGLTAPTALLSWAVLMPMGTYFYESFQDLFSSSARCPFFRQMISSPIVICSALDAEATPEPLPEPLTQRTGKVRAVCKPWLRAVGAEGCDRPSRAHRGSVRVFAHQRQRQTWVQAQSPAWLFSSGLKERETEPAPGTPAQTRASLQEAV